MRPGQRKEVPGRPLTWLTTPAFLEAFGLAKLGDLPGMDDLRAAGMLDPAPMLNLEPAEAKDGADSAGDPPADETPAA